LISNRAVCLRARAPAPQKARGSSAPCARSRLILFFQLRCAAARRARRKASEAFCLNLDICLAHLCAQSFTNYIFVILFLIFYIIDYIYKKYIIYNLYKKYNIY